MRAVLCSCEQSRTMFRERSQGETVCLPQSWKKNKMFQDKSLCFLMWKTIQSSSWSFHDYKLNFECFNHKQKQLQIVQIHLFPSLKTSKPTKIIFLRVYVLVWLLRQIFVFYKCFTCRRKSKSAILDHSWWWISVQPHSALGTLPFCQHFCFNSCWYLPQVNLTEEWVLLSVGLSEESQRITGQAWPAEKGKTKNCQTGVLTDLLDLSLDIV